MVDMNHETIVTVSLALAVCMGWFGLGAWIGVRFGRQAAEPLPREPRAAVRKALGMPARPARKVHL